jgi:hypothetical protein
MMVRSRSSGLPDLNTQLEGHWLEQVEAAETLRCRSR